MFKTIFPAADPTALQSFLQIEERSTDPYELNSIKLGDKSPGFVFAEAHLREGGPNAPAYRRIGYVPVHTADFDRAGLTPVIWLLAQPNAAQPAAFNWIELPLSYESSDMFVVPFPDYPAPQMPASIPGAYPGIVNF